MTTQKTIPKKWAEYYDQENILDEIMEDPVTFILDEGLLQEIVSGKRKRKLKNISIKMDPLHVKAIKKLATMKAIPYQTLVRYWLVEDIRKELDAVTK
jgi:predicted DNA binding CopG/RHH family protein